MNRCTLLLVVAAVAASDASTKEPATVLSTLDTQLRAKLISGVDDVVAGHIPDAVGNSIGDVEAILTPTFKSMTKNAKGNIDDDDLYYVLQRFFSQQHGWTFGAFGQGTIELIKEKFSSHREGGFALNDIAVIAATIQHIVKGSELAADAHTVERHNEGCMSKEGMLFDMELGQSGRVPLSDFFHIAINEPSHLIPDSVHMLRANGALDEADASNPKIITPNYMASPSNCISHSSLFSICCPDGCLQLLSHIEAAVGKDASAEELVSFMEDAPVQLTGLSDGFVPLQLVRKLRDMTSFNGGRVPLHGEAFAQWLHVVTPQTCVLPQGRTTIPSKEALNAENGKMAIEEDLFAARKVTGTEAAENPAVGRMPSKDGLFYVAGTMIVAGLLAAACRRVVSPSKKAA